MYYRENDKVVRPQLEHYEEIDQEPEIPQKEDVVPAKSKFPLWVLILVILALIGIGVGFIFWQNCKQE